MLAPDAPGSLAGIVARIEHHAAVRGAAPALLGPDGVMSYAALNRAANRVAHALLAMPERSAGSGNGLVAICMAPTTERIVAVIGALKAGFGYVPMNPALPDEGLRPLLEHAAPRCVLTDATASARLHSLAKQVIDASALGDDGPETNPGRYPSGDDIAFIRYTSGSTGVPKGVVHNHRAAMGQSLSYNAILDLGPDDRVSVLAFFPHAGILGTLAVGAALQVIDPKRDGIRAIAQRLRDERITVLQVFPSAFRTVAIALRHGGPLPALRCVAFTGEPVSGADVAMARRCMEPGGLVVNKLGSSEFIHIASCTVDADMPADSVVPAGFPPAGVSLRLMEADGSTTPAGEVGEIEVRSRFMGTGYWKRPDRTAAVFSVAADGSGDGLYRTGDLGRFDADGRLVVLGRVDNQIKLNGFRTSPEEIEDVLSRHEAIAAAVVRPFTDERGRVLLAAFVQPSARAVAEPKVLREFARARLPEAIVPVSIIVRDELPRTAAGKVDRRALPDPLPIWRGQQA